MGQLVSVFGIVFISGLILYFLARSTRRVYRKSAGSTLDIIITGWIGTPVHEFGHIVFCLLFFHKIERVKLFDPDPTDGSIGYVYHSYNPKNLYHRIGNFFIGIGPILIGSLALYLAMIYLIPSMKEVFVRITEESMRIRSAGLSDVEVILKALSNAITATLGSLFTMKNFNDWHFWVFLYLSICIASHMELSPPDLKSAFIGFLNLVLVVFLLNLVIMLLELAGIHVFLGPVWEYINIQTYMVGVSRITGVTLSLFIFAGIISALNLVMSWLILSVYSLLQGRGLINPFWG